MATHWTTPQPIERYGEVVQLVRRPEFFDGFTRFITSTDREGQWQVTEDIDEIIRVISVFIAQEGTYEFRLYLGKPFPELWEAPCFHKALLRYALRKTATAHLILGDYAYRLHGNVNPSEAMQRLQQVFDPEQTAWYKSRLASVPVYSRYFVNDLNDCWSDRLDEFGNRVDSAYCHAQLNGTEPMRQQFDKRMRNFIF